MATSASAATKAKAAARKTNGCRSCARPIAEGKGFCACGSPTPYLDHAGRSGWELQQWLAHRERESKLA